MSGPAGTGRPWPLVAYGIGMSLLSPVAPLVLNMRRKRGKEDGTRLAERQGHPGRPRPDGRLVWLHGASVGETVSLLPVVTRLTQRGCNVLVTSGTVTSAQVMEKRLPARALHQYLPLDIPSHIRRFLDHWRPDLAVIAESELWPNLLAETHARGVPLLLSNARMSERSFRRWQKAPKVARALLRHFDLCLAQSAQDAFRLGALGAPRVVDIGNIKFDVAAPSADPGQVARLTGLMAGRPVWLAASTHPGEDEAIIAAHRALAPVAPGLITLIVPRHPHRGGDIAAIARMDGLRAGQRSRGDHPDRATDIYVGDTIGEMGLYFRLAPIVFMGGSLVRHGGQNPIEPAKLGATLLHGPHVHNFTPVYGALAKAGGAIEVSDAATLAGTIRDLLADPARTRHVARAGLEAVQGLGGAVDRTLAAIEPYLMALDLAERR